MTTLEKGTTRQRVLAYLRDYVAEHGWSPTYSEISDEVGVASVNAVRKHVVALQNTGYLKMPATQVTGRITLVSPAPDGWKSNARK